MSAIKEAIFNRDGTLSDYSIASGLTQSEPWHLDILDKRQPYNWRTETPRGKPTPATAQQ